ncbi:MAG: YoaK family protein [Archangium sp.]|nr:YoaK family protein [Archangium sp.]MDP3152787.1 YoaK family protein [Archangium sp.]MDP3573574.1 YoaK family protein [Archangium sp.]
MSWRHTPAWISFGGSFLALNAGYINATGFLQVHEHGLTHLTGQVTRAGIELAGGRVGDAGRAAALVLWFFLGALVSGIIIRRSELAERGRPYGVAMLVESALLAAAAGLLIIGASWGASLAAVAAGLQNALATSYSSAVVRTTHMTGIVTDLGVHFGHAIRGEPIEWGKVKLLGLLFGGFLLGGFLGAMAFPVLRAYALLLPAFALGAGALAFFWRLRR